MPQEIEKIRKFWKPEGKADPEREKHLRRAIKQAGVEELSLTYFLYHSDHHSKHQDVLKAIAGAGGK